MKVPKWMLNDTVTIRAYSGSGAYGPIYKDTVTKQARVQHSRERTLDDEGNEVVSDTKVFLRPGINIPPESEVGFNDHTYEVTETRDYSGLYQESHIEAILI